MTAPSSSQVGRLEAASPRSFNSCAHGLVKSIHEPHTTFSLGRLGPGERRGVCTFWQQGWAWSGRAGSVSFGFHWRDTFFAACFLRL